MSPLLRILLGCFVLAGPFYLSGCDSNDGPMEEAGEAIDDAADDVGDAVDDAKDELD